MEVIWNYSAVAAEFILTALLGILQSMLVVRAMPQAEYGQFTYTVTLLSYFGFISAWSMMFLAVKEYSQRPDDAPRIFKAIIHTRLLLTVPLGLLYVFIPLFVPKSGVPTHWVVFITFFCSLVNCFGGDLIYLFMSRGKQRIGAALGVTSATMNLLVLFAVSKLPSGISQQSVSAAGLIASVITTCVGIRIAKRLLGLDSLGLTSIDWREIKTFLRNGLTLFPGRIAVQIYTTIAMVLAGIYLSLDDVALFRVGAAFATYITGAAMLSTRITTPLLTRESLNLGSPQFNRAAYQHTYFLCLVAFGAIVGTYGFGGWLLETVYGARYKASETVTFWIVFQLMGMATLNALDTVLYARGMNKQMSLILFSGVVAGIIGGFTLIPTMGVVGAGITVCLVQVVVHLVEIPFLPPDYRWFWVKPSMLPMSCMAAALALIALLKYEMPHSAALPLYGLGIMIAYFAAAGLPLARKLLFSAPAASPI